MNRKNRVKEKNKFYGLMKKGFIMFLHLENKQKNKDDRLLSFLDNVNTDNSNEYKWNIKNEQERT